MPSVKEGWGLVVVEAAAHGTPTVAFRSAGGSRESVRHRETGLLAEDEAGFVDAVHRLLADDGLRTGMGRAARAHAASFSWTSAARAFEAEIRAAAGLPPRVSEQAPAERVPAVPARSAPQRWS